VCPRLFLGETPGVYVGTESARLLGAELICPDAEHLARLRVLAAEQHLTMPDMLRMSFYHPIVEEALHAALKLVSKSGSQESSLCSSCPELPLCWSTAVTVIYRKVGDERPVVRGHAGQVAVGNLDSFYF
jgi:hypothetical protein